MCNVLNFSLHITWLLHLNPTYTQKKFLPVFNLFLLILLNIYLTISLYAKKKSRNDKKLYKFSDQVLFKMRKDGSTC